MLQEDMKSQSLKMAKTNPKGWNGYIYDALKLVEYGSSYTVNGQKVSKLEALTLMNIFCQMDLENTYENKRYPIYIKTWDIFDQEFDVMYNHQKFEIIGHLSKQEHNEFNKLLDNSVHPITTNWRRV